MESDDAGCRYRIGLHLRFGRLVIVSSIFDVRNVPPFDCDRKIIHTFDCSLVQLDTWKDTNS